jgi:hypothetical protein
VREIFKIIVVRAGNPYRKGSPSTVDLLIHLAHFAAYINNVFNVKMS